MAVGLIGSIFLKRACAQPKKTTLNFIMHIIQVGVGSYDTWWFYLPGTSRPFWNDGWDPGKSLWLGSSIHNNSFKFNTYVDTTPPPKKPKELE
ncbi:putative secreted protein [Candidatus Phytoplasma solani]